MRSVAGVKSSRGPILKTRPIYVIVGHVQGDKSSGSQTRNDVFYSSPIHIRSLDLLWASYRPIHLPVGPVHRNIKLLRYASSQICYARAVQIRSLDF